MGLIARFLDWLCRRSWGKASNGLELDYANAWCVTCDREIDTSNVYRRLDDLLPEGTNVCLEVISPPQDVRDLLVSRAASGTSTIRPGTLWPRSSFFHLPASRGVLDELAAIAEKHSPHDMGHHLYAYKGTNMLLAWHDFPDPECLAISAELPYEAIQRFCDSIGCVPGRCVS